MPASSTLKFNAILLAPSTPSCRLALQVLLSWRTKVCNTIVIEHVRVVHPCQKEQKKVKWDRNRDFKKRRQSHRQKQNKEVFPLAQLRCLKMLKSFQQQHGNVWEKVLEGWQGVCYI